MKQTTTTENKEKQSVKNIAIYIALLTMTTNAVIDLFNKWKEYYTANYIQSYVPEWSHEIQIDDISNFESIFTGSVYDIIQKKWWYDGIPNSISYKKNGMIESIDVSCYLENLNSANIWLFNTRWNSEISHASGLIYYLEKDFKINKVLFEEISSQRINIVPEDSYRDKVAKIQKFVRSLWYERDLIYLWETQKLPALSDYQLPSLANLMIGKMDCNNKTGLFIQLCRSNDILVWVGSSLTHMTPVVYSNKNDAMRKIIKANTAVWYTHNWIVVDPTNTDISNGSRRPAIAGDMIGDSYVGMKFVIAQCPK